MEKSGIIVKGVGGLYTVDCGGELVECRARGHFRHERITPSAGDFVTLEDGGEGSETSWAIARIGERSSLMIRPPLANLGAIYIGAAAAKPDPVMLTIDKMTVIAENCGITPYIVITKGELAPALAADIEKTYSLAGIKTFVTSSENGDGIGELREFVRRRGGERISAFAGASGVGKSTLMNALFPELSLQTGEISHRIERGKNTTRSVELFPCGETEDGGRRYIADTPGFSLLDFIRYDFLKKDELVYAFREFAPYLGHCRYTRCTHLCEDGCAVVEAVNGGKISKSRHESYVTLYNELKTKHEWDKR